MAKRETKLLDAALNYAQLGWPIHPLKGKKPLLTKWQVKASVDTHVIEQWWSNWPEANIGIVTRNCVVIDVDIKNGKNGAESLRVLESELGPLPDTYTVETPNGFHLYFECPTRSVPNSVSSVADGIDSRADNAYVVAPPSIVAGGRYELAKDIALAVLPEEWVSALIATCLSSSITIDEGSRNETVYKEACRFRSRNYPFEQALELLLHINTTQCEPSLSKSEVVTCLKSAYKFQPGYEPNDMGNAQRLLDAADGRIIFVPGLSFFIFDGSRWVEDPHDFISLALLKHSNRRIKREAMLIEDDRLRDKREKFGIASQNTQRLKQSLESAKSEPDVLVPLDRLNADPWLLGVRNGVVDLRRGLLLKAKKKYFITKSAGCEYIPDAKCPQWRQFIEQALGNNVGLIRYVQRVVGYCLTGITTEQVFFAILGPAATGKSTFLEVLAELFGDYGSNIRTDALMAGPRHKGGPSEDEARLVGVRFLTTNETSEGSRFNQALIKDLTGGDRITARLLYRNSFEYRPQFKLAIRGNHRPRFDGEDTGMARRIRLIPFTRQVREEHRDHDLGFKLRQEMPGILNWAIKGCVDWRKRGLADPKAVKQATTSYVDEMDVFGAFLKNECQVHADYRAPFAKLFAAYAAWCKSKGHTPKSENAVAEMLTIRGFDKCRFRIAGRLVRGRTGIRLNMVRLRRKRKSTK